MDAQMGSTSAVRNGLADACFSELQLENRMPSESSQAEKGTHDSNHMKHPGQPTLRPRRRTAIRDWGSFWGFENAQGPEMEGAQHGEYFVCHCKRFAFVT